MENKGVDVCDTIVFMLTVHAARNPIKVFVAGGDIYFKPNESQSFRKHTIMEVLVIVWRSSQACTVCNVVSLASSCKAMIAIDAAGAK